MFKNDRGQKHSGRIRSLLTNVQEGKKAPPPPSIETIGQTKAHLLKWTHVYLITLHLEQTKRE
jgi:hypothetical protein